MLISDFYKIPITVSLGIVAGILVASIVASLVFPAAGEPTTGQGGDGHVSLPGEPVNPVAVDSNPEKDREKETVA
jgi:hypothetical protein